MNRLLSRGLLALGLCLLVAGPTFAQNSPVGEWRTIDDRTGEARTIVEIVREADGTYAGYIREIFRADRRDAVCEECPSDWGQGQPLQGLKIIRGVSQRGSDWSGGQILDPEEGKVYGVRLRPVDDGQRLEVRGFLRVPLMGSALGRTQTWERVR